MPLNIFIEAFIGGLLTGGIYGVIALGLTLIFGILRVINFAHGEFLMIGMYISYFACTGLGILSISFSFNSYTDCIFAWSIM